MAAGGGLRVHGSEDLERRLGEHEQRIDDLRGFEREYRSRLIEFHRAALAALLPSGRRLDPRRMVMQIRALASTGQYGAAARAERDLYLSVLTLCAAAEPAAPQMATAALAAARIDFPRGGEADHG